MKKINSTYIYWGISISLLALVLMLTIIYLWKFMNNGFSQNMEDFGLTGDYFGGVVGSITAFLSVILVYRTFKMQQEISAKQEYLIAHQNFENVLFNMLEMQHNITNECRGIFNRNFWDSTKIEISGLSYFRRMELELHKSIYDFNYILSEIEKESENDLRLKIHAKYEDLYIDDNAMLGHYFRHLYHMLKYVNDSTFSEQEKTKYMNLIQSQMSNSELYLTFYNGISNFGITKAYPILDKYNFLENLYVKDDLIFDSGFFYKKTTFKNKSIQN